MSPRILFALRMAERQVQKETAWQAAENRKAGYRVWGRRRIFEDAVYVFKLGPCWFI